MLFLKRPIVADREQRTPEMLLEQYDLEKSLAAKLRTASKSARGELYSSVYDELFRNTPHHPQIAKKADAMAAGAEFTNQLRLLSRFLRSDTVFLEIGAGDCAFSIAVANQVQQVYAIDVSEEITRSIPLPRNVQLILSDGSSIPVPPGSVDIAYSNQLMEHLHPDDALDQLRNIHRALKPGGKYICLTPNRLTGPHDISRYFDRVATGLHLKEYTVCELTALFREVGFRQVDHYLRLRGRFSRFPTAAVRVVERSMMSIPNYLARRAARTLFIRGLVSIRLVACK